jgi:hypothetical protein
LLRACELVSKLLDARVPHVVLLFVRCRRGEANVGRVDVLDLAVVAQDHTCVGVDVFQKHAGDV